MTVHPINTLLMLWTRVRQAVVDVLLTVGTSETSNTSAVISERNLSNTFIEKNKGVFTDVLTKGNAVNSLTRQ